MYIAKNIHTIHEEFGVQNAKGEVELCLPVHLHIDDILKQYNQLRTLLGNAQTDLQNAPDDETKLVAFGAVVVELMKLIFGPEGTEKLLSYYEDRPMDVLQDVAPFLVEVIHPQMQAAMQARVESYNRAAAKLSNSTKSFNKRIKRAK